MKTFLKLEGPVKDGVKALEKLALETPEVCIMDTYIQSEAPMFDNQTGIMNYFAAEGETMEKRCATIISKSRVSLKGYDFVFEWFVEPSKDQLDMVLKKIDDTLKPLGVKYTYMTKK
jgi:hypothetical protein